MRLDRKPRVRGLGCLRSVCQVEGFALHLEIRLHVDFGGLHVHMAKEIFDHDERNAGLEQDALPLVCLMVCGLIRARARVGIELAARRKYFSRMYRAPCRLSRLPRPF